MFIFKIVLIAFLLFIPASVVSANNLDSSMSEFDYINASRGELLFRCLYLARELKASQDAHKQTSLKLVYYIDYSVIITSQMNAFRHNNNILLTENKELKKLLEYPYQAFDLALDIYCGVGTSIDIGLTGKLYLWRGLFGFISVDGFYGKYWQFITPPYVLAIGGLGWTF